jgi:hypothetical protein
MPNVVTNVGVHEKWTAPDYGRRPEQILQRFPGATIGRNAFINRTGSTTPEDLRPFVNRALEPFVNAGTPRVYVSVKTPIPATRNGDWNDRYRQLGEHLAQLNRAGRIGVEFIAYHEPENVFSSGAAYAHYANKVREQMKRGGGNDINVGYTAMAYQWSPNRAATANPAPWREAEMDFYSVDVYSGRSYPLEAILSEHSGFTRWYREIADHGSRSGRYRVTERGFETPSSTNPTKRFSLRNQSINREFNWLRNSRIGRLCQDYIYWNSSGTEEAMGLKLDSSGEQVLATRIAEFAKLNA